jgi:hypothetical protein
MTGIDFNICTPFINCEANLNATIELPPKTAFFHAFKTVTLFSVSNSMTFKFQSFPLKMMESLDALYSVRIYFHAEELIRNQYQNLIGFQSKKIKK